jgi:hypothetical protein
VLGQRSRHQRCPTLGPHAVLEHGWSLTQKRSVFVMFGGRKTDGTDSNETWEWDGSQWHKKIRVNTPLARDATVSRKG